MRIDPEISSVGVVLRGNFNPAIFTPAWFALHEVLPKPVAENAALQVAHPGLMVFTTEWIELQVTSDTFQADTQQGPHVRVRDLVIHVFKELLPHTPINALRIIRAVHFRALNAAARDGVGKILAPVEPWCGCAELLQLPGECGGMTSLNMSQLRPAGRPPSGKINVTVEPSNRRRTFGDLRSSQRSLCDRQRGTRARRTRGADRVSRGWLR